MYSSFPPWDQIVVKITAGGGENSKLLGLDNSENCRLRSESAFAEAGQIKPLKLRLAGTSAGLTIWPQAPEHSPTVSQTPYPHDPVIAGRHKMAF